MGATGVVFLKSEFWAVLWNQSILSPLCQQNQKCSVSSQVKKSSPVTPQHWSISVQRGTQPHQHWSLPSALRLFSDTSHDFSFSNSPHFHVVNSKLFELLTTLQIILLDKPLAHTLSNSFLDALWNSDELQEILNLTQSRMWTSENSPFLSERILGVTVQELEMVK